MAACERLPALKEKILLLVCLFCVMSLTNGVSSPGFSYFLVNFVDELNSTSALVGLSHSISLGIVAIFGPLIFSMVKIFGYKRTMLIGCFLSSAGLICSSQATELWQIFLTHALATGLGLCTIELTFTYVISEHFDHSASLYFGFMHAGSAVGFCITPVACSYLRTLYGWRGSLFLSGAVALNSMVIAMVFFNTLPKLLHHRRLKGVSSEEDDADDNKVVDKYQSEVVGEIDDVTCETSKDVQPAEHLSKLVLFRKYPKLIMMSVQVCVVYFSYLGFFVHFSAGVISKGISEEDAAVLFAMFGIGSLIGRLLSFVPVRLGLISEHNLYTLSLMMVAAEMLTFALFKSLIIINVVSLLLGISIGGVLITFPVVTRAFVPRDRFSEAYGVLIVPGGISCIVSGYIMGAIYDVTDSYNGAFFLASGCMFAMGLLMFCPKMAEMINRKRTCDSKPLPAVL